MTTLDDREGADGGPDRFLAGLEDDCARCGGSGRVVNDAWRAWHERADELVRVAQAVRRAAELNAPDRENAARQCQEHEPEIVRAIDRTIDDHVRARPADPERVGCAACRGSGRVLSPAGLRLVEFLRRHGFVRDR
ncbi:hypothetical protein [Spirillospora sp. CA-294931]|uniref:hypothetical protein n=1 Tax=Spirillospora sp. CA-294931 TaxID=3240042 RepID=UPI003D93DEDA